jgi:hypothetical protein
LSRVRNVTLRPSSTAGTLLEHSFQVGLIVSHPVKNNDNIIMKIDFVCITSPLFHILDCLQLTFVKLSRK